MFQASIFSWFFAAVASVLLPSLICFHVALAEPIDAKLEGPRSSYTDVILRMVRSWPPLGLGLEHQAGQDDNPVRLRGFETPEHSFYIGLQQEMVINAPLSQVEAVLDDMNHYQDLFPGYDDIHIISKSANKILTLWEQHIPLFFLPNVKYEVVYLVDKTLPNRRMYRYKLKESKDLKVNDGLIVIESDADGKPKTRYTEYDFFDANWGVLKTIAPGRIWKDSVEGIYLSDLAILLKAEHPDWSYKKIREESRKSLETYPVDKVIEGKKPFSFKESAPHKP